jgi:hypothetical protein
MNDMAIRKFPYDAFTSFLPILCCIGASLLTALIIQIFLAIGSFDWSQSSNWRALAWAIIIPACLTAIAVLLKQIHIFNLSSALQMLFTIMFVAVAVNIIWEFWHLIQYGDSFGVNTAISTNGVFHRWFLGTTILSRAYHLLWPTFGSYLPNKLANIDIFVRLTGATIMWCSSIIFLRHYGAQFRLLIPLLSPVYLLFCSGYNEYYPFITWEYMIFLFILFDDLSKRSPQFIAAISSVMALSYGAFIPIILVLFVCYGLSTNIKKTITAVCMTGAWCAFLLILLWPDTILSFIISYFYSLPLGDKSIIFGPYVHKSAGPLSPFFTLSYSFSLEHLSHLCFMFFFGAGPILALSFVGGLFVCRKKEIPDQTSGIKPVFCLAACLALQLLYFLFMLPKLGPILDIDLFFMVYLNFGFIAGIFVDIFLDTVKDKVRDIWAECITASMLSSSTVILLQLLWIGFH